MKRTAHHKSQHNRPEFLENGFMKTKNARYWACQVVGWGAYSFGVGLSTAVMANGWRRSIVIGYLLFFLYSIGLTHLLRTEIHRRNWTSLSLPRALAQLVPASILVAGVQSALVVGVYTGIEGNLGEWSQASSIAYMFIGLSVIDTIWAILYLAITTFRRSREVQRSEMQMKLALSNAELRALESQVNPHFLFNCLNSIRGMISENPAEAQDMVTRLANILRYNLQKDRHHTVPLASEIEAVSDYLALESIRFEDRLRVHVEVDDAVRESMVPPMLLQTLVENAIKHGVEEVTSGSDLFIRAALDGNGLRIEVENAGRLSDPRPGSTQIGLTNARERLRLLYGEHASLQLGARGNGRVAATILIPTTT
jgi:LytS/YehU family sensor histidine kinase